MTLLVRSFIRRPVQGYTDIGKTGLTTPPHPPQGSVEGFRHGGRWQIFSADFGPVRPSAPRCAHRWRPNHPEHVMCVCVCIYIYIYILHNMYKKKKRPNVLRRGNVQYIHENWIGSFLSKRILNSYPLVYTVQA